MRNDTATIWAAAANEGGSSSNSRIGGAISTPTTNGASMAVEGLAPPPPQHLFGDYVEMVYLGFVILAGTSINVYVLHKLLRERKRKSVGKQNVGFLLLKINLNLSDLLILVVHALGKLIWLAEYEWRFGELLCRIFNFFSMFTLYLSSNIVVCIALDRLRTVVQAKKPIVSRKQSIIRMMVFLAWLLALVWSLPQLYFWRTINVFPEYPGGWIQCSDIWSIERYEIMRNANHPPMKSIFISNFTQNLYDLTHLCFVFYGPLVLLIGCYLFILVRLLRFAKSPAAANLENKQKSGVPASSFTPMQFASGVHHMTAPAVVPRGVLPMRKSKAILHEDIDSSKLSSTSMMSVRGDGDDVPLPPVTTLRTCRNYIEKRLSLSLPVADKDASLASADNTLQKFVDKLPHDAQIVKPSNVKIEQAPTVTDCHPVFIKVIRRALPFEKGGTVQKTSLSNGSALGLLTRKARTQSKYDLEIHSQCLDSESALALSASQSTLPTLDMPKDDTNENKGFLLRLIDAFVDISRHFLIGSAKWQSDKSTGHATMNEQDNFNFPDLAAVTSKNRSQSMVESWYVDASRQTCASDKRLSYSSGITGAITVTGTSSYVKPLSRLCFKRFSSPATAHVIENGASVMHNATKHHGKPAKHYRYTRTQRDKINTDSDHFFLNNTTGHRGSNGAPRRTTSAKPVPIWRRQMKSRVFRTTLLVIVTHVVLWLPYNSYALMKYINVDFYTRMNEKANVLKDLQFFITIINPFLYGFTQQ